MAGFPRKPFVSLRRSNSSSCILTLSCSVCCSDVDEAAQRGHLECLTRLLSIGKEPIILGPYGQSTLAIAAFAGHTEVVRLLLQQKSAREMAIRENKGSGNQPLLCAVLSGSPEVLELLLKSTFRDKMHGVAYSQTPSFAMTGEADIETAPWGPLCMVGVLLNIRPVPQHLETLLQLLLKAGFSPNSLDGVTMPPLLVALLIAFDKERYQQVGKLVRCLLEHGADPAHQYLAHRMYGGWQLAPSALALGFEMRCWAATREMIDFIALAPLSLLSMPGVCELMDPKDYSGLVPRLIEYGWQQGSPWLSHLTTRMKFFERQGPAMWGEHLQPVSAFLHTLSSPCSLRRLARLKVRELYHNAASNHGSTLPIELQTSPDLPPGIKPFLLLQEP